MTSQRIRLASAMTALTGLAALTFALTVTAQPSGTGEARGQELYDKHCSECHGSSGQGDGPAAQLLLPRPRDFTAGKYKVRSTETGSLPTDDDLLRAVRQGLQGTSMPAWDKLLSDQDIRTVVAYLKTMSRRFGSEAPQPVQIAPKVTEQPGNVGRGRQSTRSCSAASAMAPTAEAPAPRPRSASRLSVRST